MFRRQALSLLLCGAVLISGLLGGCARAARDTSGFALSNNATVPAGFDETWQAVKHVLRKADYELYTRDKRGTFVAYTKEKRRLLQPQRVKYTVTLSVVAEKETQVEVEAVKQVYGVTLLTYPGWHDRKLSEDAGVQTILEALQAEIAAPTATTVDDAVPVEPEAPGATPAQ